MISKMILTMIPVVAVVGGALYYGNNHIAISKHNIRSSKIPKSFNGFKILQLSDLHSKCFGKGNHKLLEVIDKEKPNIIVMTGDMINSSEREFTIFLDLARSLANYNVYFVEGNNETKLPKAKKLELIKGMEDAGIEILDNSRVKLTREGKSINLYGVWCDLCYYKEIKGTYNKDTYFEKNDLEKHLGSCNLEEYNILLAHNPFYFESYAQWGADLTLSGHVHGGIIRIPGVGGLLSPEKKFFPEYSQGLYKKQDKNLIVNRGLSGKPFLPRVLNMPEISVITLNHK